MKPFLAAAVLWLSLASALAQSVDPQTTQRRASPQTESRKTLNGFSGWLLVTFEEHFDVELNTPSELARSLSDADLVKVGEKLLIMILFANPALHSDGFADVQCDIAVVKPDQTVSIYQTGVQCTKSRPAVDKNNRYMAGMIIRLIPESTDPKGNWTIRVALRDRVRGTEIRLNNSFTLE